MGDKIPLIPAHYLQNPYGSLGAEESHLFWQALCALQSIRPKATLPEITSAALIPNRSATSSQQQATKHRKLNFSYYYQLLFLHTNNTKTSVLLFWAKC